MPEAFDKCAATKGRRIRTISGPNKQFGLGKGEYVHVCFLGKKMFRGNVKKKTADHDAERAAAKGIRKARL